MIGASACVGATHVPAIIQLLGRTVLAHVRGRAVAPHRGVTDLRSFRSATPVLGGDQTMSLRPRSGRTRTTFRAGLALNMTSSLVNGLMPMRAFVAGFRVTVMR